MQFLIRKGSIIDLNAINFLIDSYFGAKFHQTKDILAKKSITYVAIHNGLLIGFAHGKTIPPLNLPSEIAEIGLLDMIIVDQNYRRKKVGSALFKARIKEFEARNITQFQLNHWVRKSSPIPWLAINEGFAKFKSVPLFWKQDSLKFNFQCPECGPPPCNCTCDTYHKED